MLIYFSFFLSSFSLRLCQSFLQYVPRRAHILFSFLRFEKSIRFLFANLNSMSEYPNTSSFWKCACKWSWWQSSWYQFLCEHLSTSNFTRLYVSKLLLVCWSGSPCLWVMILKKLKGPYNSIKWLCGLSCCCLDSTTFSDIISCSPSLVIKRDNVHLDNALPKKEEYIHAFFLEYYLSDDIHYYNVLWKTITNFAKNLYRVPET